MPFYAPPSSGISPATILQTELERRKRQFDESSRNAQLGIEAGRSLGASIEADQRRQDASDLTDQQLAMTPGVTRGGSTATMGQSDSSLNVGSTHEFSRYGHEYNYDPALAGQVEGQMEGAKETSASQARYNALLKIPGFDERKAAREVYGRSGILDMPDPHDTRAALAAYMTSPSRENAAAVLAAGGSASIFPAPDMFGADGKLKPAGPAENTPEWWAMKQREVDMTTKAVKDRQAAAITERAAVQDPRLEAQQARLNLDELRKEIPRPSKAPDYSALGVAASGPLTQAAVSDSLAYEAGVMTPARQRLRQFMSGIPSAASAAGPNDPMARSEISPATAAANARMQLQVAAQKKKQAAAIAAGTAQPLDTPANAPKASTSAADLWEQKRAEGMTPEQATAWVKAHPPNDDE